MMRNLIPCNDRGVEFLTLRWRLLILAIHSTSFVMSITVLCEIGIDTYAGTSRRGSGQLTAQWSKEPQLKQGTVGFFSCG